MSDPAFDDGVVVVPSMILVEGDSDRAILRALDRRIDALSSQRRIFFSAAHELAHHVVAVEALYDACNDTGMSSLFQAIKFVRELWQPCSTDWIDFTSKELGATAPADVSEILSRLPSWAVQDFNTALSPVWLARVRAQTAGPPPTGPRVTFLPSEDMLRVLGELQAAAVRLMSFLLDIVRYCDAAIWTLRRERSHVHGRIFPRSVESLPDVRAFFLIIVSVYRRYGYRSEPDDHVSLRNRRHLVSVGSCPPI